MFRSMLVLYFCILSVFCTQSLAQVPQIVIDSKGHSARISNLHYSNDGTQIVSISEDKTIKVWDVESGDIVKKYEAETGDGFEGMFYASALSPDGKLLAVAGYKVSSARENYIIIIDLVKNAQVSTAIGHSDVINSLAFNAAGTYLASGAADNSVNIWKMDGSEQLPLVTTLNTSGPVSCVSFNPKTQDLAVAQDSKDVIVFSLAGLDQSGTKFLPKVWKQHKGVVDKVVFSPDGQFLVSTSFDNELILWKTDGRMLKEFGKLANPIHAIAFSADSKILAGLDITGAGMSWGIPSGNKFTDFRGHDNTVFCAAFSPSPSHYIVASAGGINNEILLWNPINGSTIRKIKGKGNAVQALAFGDGLNLFISQEAVKNNKPLFKTKFDFASLTIDHSANPAGIIEPKTASPISQTSENSLTLPKGKSIRTDPNEDGRILDFLQLGDGRIIVASDFSVKMYDHNGLPLKEFVGHLGAVRSIASTADGAYVATGAEDQTIILWRLGDSGFVPTLRHVFADEQWAEFFSSLPVDSLTTMPTRKAWMDVITFLKKEGVKAHREIEQVYANIAEIIIPFATLFVADDHEWVCWTPKGYFACSSNGGQYFGWHVNRGIRKLADYYSAEQFFEILYRPEDVAKSFQQGKRVEDIIKESGERLFDLTKLHRPSAAFFDIRVITRATDLLKYEKGKIYTQAKRLPIMVEVYDGGGGVKEVNIYQNDKLIITDKGVKTKGEGDKVTKTYEVEMVNEVNEFKVVVVNFQKIESRPDFLTVEYKGEILVTSTLHMLAVGINKYQNEAYNLNYAQPDAKSLVTELNEKGKKLFKEINRIEIYDEDATRENIVMAFKTLVARAKPEDVFLFYYAGHGTLDEEDDDEYYLVPTNITKLYGDPEQLKKKGISATELRELLTQIKSQKQVILMDACHSGGALKSLNVRAAATDEKAIIQLARSSGVVMLASSGTKQFATEFEELKHGVFTYALVEALEGKADTGDKKVTVNELKIYMEERVPELTKKYGGKTQYPTGYITGNDFPLTLLE